MPASEENQMIEEQSAAIQQFVRSISSAVNYILDSNHIPLQNRTGGDVAALTALLSAKFPASGFTFTLSVEPEETAAPQNLFNVIRAEAHRRGLQFDGD